MNSLHFGHNLHFLFLVNSPGDNLKGILTLIRMECDSTHVVPAISFSVGNHVYAHASSLSYIVCISRCIQQQMLIISFVMVTFHHSNVKSNHIISGCTCNCLRFLALLVPQGVLLTNWYTSYLIKQFPRNTHP